HSIPLRINILFFNSTRNPRHLHSFPTRRSSDLKTLIEKHVLYTNSSRGKALLEDWESNLKNFVKVMPTEYKLALKRLETEEQMVDRKSTRLNSSHVKISYAVFCLKKKIKSKPLK